MALAAGGTLAQPQLTAARAAWLTTEMALLFVAAPVAMHAAVHQARIPLFLALLPVLVVILAILLATESRGQRYPGRTFWLYMLLYAISRFVIEIYRGDPRGAVGPFSTSQFISLILGPLAVAMLVYLRRQPAPVPRGARKAA